MPPIHKRSSRKRRSSRLLKRRHPSFNVCAPTLRRHSSFHARPAPMTDPIPQRPNNTRHVSFNLDTSKLLRASSTLPRRLSSTKSPFSFNQFVESPESSHRSSEDSTILPSASSFKNYDATSGYHSSPSMNTVELDIRPTQPYPLSRFGKRLPGMKNAFAGKKKSSSSSTSTPSTEPALKSELLPSSTDSPYIPTSSLSESESRPGTAGSTNSVRSSFVRTFITNRSKTAPLSRTYHI